MLNKNCVLQYITTYENYIVNNFISSIVMQQEKLGGEVAKRRRGKKCGICEWYLHRERVEHLRKYLLEREVRYSGWYRARARCLFLCFI
jgi:hypothetical protein